MLHDAARGKHERFVGRRRHLNNRLLKAAIQDLCDEVLIAERATQGIEIAIQRRPDLIFLDLPVVIVSAQVFPEVVAGALREGCEAYITKPVKLSLVRDAVLRHATRQTKSLGTEGNLVQAD